MLCFGVSVTIVTVPLMTAIGRNSNPYVAFGLILIALVGASFYTAISGIVKAELFPIEIRALGVGLSYAIANALFGGTLEYIALWLKQQGVEPVFFWYVTALGAIALVASWLMPDSRKYGYMVD